MIFTTLQNFLKVAELMEGHRIAGVSWGKLQRNILAKNFGLNN